MLKFRIVCLWNKNVIWFGKWLFSLFFIFRFCRGDAFFMMMIGRLH